MKCKCSLNNNYEVIGLCDIKKFNEKINKFKDQAWTQITIPEKLFIPSNKPPVKNITKVYLDIKITSTKIIKTPSSDNPNVEGLKITGKLLLVSGKICQRIVYISDEVCDRICSEKFNVEFNTHISVDKNTDIENGAFCVYPCIEDVSVRILNERVLTKSVTLFLFAHQIADPTQPVEKLDNAFIFNSSDPDEEMAMVEFDKNNKKLIVTSTGLSYNNTGLREAYKFELISGTDEITVKASHSIGGNENADGFRDALDGTGYDVGDIVKLTFSNKFRLWLTNYIAQGSKYYMISENMQSFKINENGIVPYILRNSIYLTNSAKKVVASIQFDILTEELLVYGSSSNRTNNVAGADYFKVTLNESDALTERKTSSVAGNTNGRSFATTLNDTRFEFGDILKLEYKEANMIKISNYPGSSTTVYTPKGSSEYFEITKTGLKSFKPLANNNAIVFNSFPNNQRMGDIRFDRSKKKLLVNSSAQQYSDTPIAGPVYKFELLASDGTTSKASSSLNWNNVFGTFILALDDKDFEFGDLVKLEFYSNLVLWLSDYPKDNDKYYMVSKKAQGFKINPNGVVPYVLKNYIALDNSNSKRIVTIHFDILYKTLLVDGSSSNNANSGGTNYFKVTLYQSDGRTEKKSSSVAGGRNGTGFSTNLNDTRFEFNDVLKLSYEEADMITVTDYPNTTTPVYHPTGSEEYFKITMNGLQEFMPSVIPPITKLANAFILKNTQMQELAKVEFDTTNMVLLATSTGVAFSGSHTQTHIQFTLIGSDGTQKAYASIGTNQNADKLKASLNNKSFVFGDSITIFYINQDIVTLTNYPTTGKDYVLPNAPTQKKFTITKTGIVEFIPPPPVTKLQNIVIFSNNQNEEMMRVEFDITNKKFIAIATDKVGNTGTPNIILFLITFNSVAYDIKYSGTAQDAASRLNDVPFKLNATFKISYRIEANNQVKITNFPNQGQMYTPPKPEGGTVEDITFKITSTGLEKVKLPVKELPNVFTLKNLQNQQVVTLKFDINNKELIVTSTGVVFEQIPTGSKSAFTFSLLNSNQSVEKANASIQNNQNGDAFKNSLNGKSFEVGDIIFTSTFVNNALTLSNYPTTGENLIFEGNGNPVIIKITQTGLIAK